MQNEEKGTILFVCTGNTCRSPMAAALFRYLCPDSAYAALSAGLAAPPGHGASDGAIIAMQAYDIDLSGHSSQPVTEELLEQADLVLTMTNGHKQLLEQAAPELAAKVMTLAAAAGRPNTDVADPYGLDDAAYQAAAKMIRELLEEYLASSGADLGCSQKT